MNQFTASLWGDEAFAAVLAQKPYWQIVLQVARDTSPPLFYLSLHTWMKLFGSSEPAIRTHSFFYFLLLVYVVYLLGKHLFDKKIGAIAAILTFLNPFLFQYGFEGRMYSILAFYSTLSMYFFITQKKWPYILASTAALYSHHFAIFIILSQFIFQLPKLKKNFLETIKPFFWIGFFYLPWLYPLYYQTSLVTSGFWLAKPDLESVYHLFRSFLAGGFEHQLKNKILLVSGLLLLSRRWQKQDFLLLGWLALPISLTFIFSQLKQSIFFDRYLLFIIPSLILLLTSRLRKISYPLLALLIFWLGLTTFSYFTHPTKRPFRELAQFIHQTTRLDDALINWSGQAHHFFESKYYGLAAPLYYPQGEPPFYIGTALMEARDIIQELPVKERIGVITSDSVESVTLPGYQQGQVNDFSALKLIWFIKKP